MGRLRSSTMVWASAHWTSTVTTSHHLVKTMLAEKPSQRGTLNSVRSNVCATLTLLNNIVCMSWRGCSKKNEKHDARAVCKRRPWRTASISLRCTRGMTYMLTDIATRLRHLLFTQSCQHQIHLTLVRKMLLWTKCAPSTTTQAQQETTSLCLKACARQRQGWSAMAKRPTTLSWATLRITRKIWSSPRRSTPPSATFARVGEHARLAFLRTPAQSSTRRATVQTRSARVKRSSSPTVSWSTGYVQKGSVLGTFVSRARVHRQHRLVC